MSDLRILPVFGFETERHHLDERGSQILNNYSFQLLPIIRPQTENGWKSRNIMRIVFYIPIISTIIAISSLIFVKCHAKKGIPVPKELYSCGHKVRDVFTALSLGALFIIPDVIATIWRNCCDERTRPSSGPINLNA